MCFLNQDTGLGKLADKAHSTLGKVSPGAMVADKTKRAAFGDEFVDSGGMRSMLYADYKSKDEKKRLNLMSSAPEYGTQAYSDWYKTNEKSLLG